MASSLNSENIPNNIVFYDGYCVLCSRSIDFILSRDSLATFRFASLQSDFAQRILPELGYPVVNIQNLSNIVYLRRNDIKIKSDAILSILWDLGGIYRSSRLVYCLPRVIRDFSYDRLAKLRYRIFGKRDSCRVPTLQEKTRFLG
jgi:predicted DCC family thiol-disulfide oxidoreductase YuxK